MRISIRPSSKNVDSIYIIKDLYLRDVRGKKASLNPSGKERTTVTVKKLGRIPDLMDEMHLSRDEVIAWAKEQARIMTEEEKKKKARKWEFNQQFRQGILCLSAALNAGYSIENAFGEAIGDLSLMYDEDADIIQEFTVTSFLHVMSCMLIS